MGETPFAAVAPGALYRRRRLQGCLAGGRKPRQMKPMSSDQTSSKRAVHNAVQPAQAPRRPLALAAARALAEAAARRAERDRRPEDRPREVAGRGGLDPTRYGDWEINGLASDF